MCVCVCVRVSVCAPCLTCLCVDSSGDDEMVITLAMALENPEGGILFQVRFLLSHAAGRYTVSSCFDLTAYF
jgi:hypothetical protein